MINEKKKKKKKIYNFGAIAHEVKITQPFMMFVKHSTVQREFTNINGSDSLVDNSILFKVERLLPSSFPTVQSWGS